MNGERAHGVSRCAPTPRKVRGTTPDPQGRGYYTIDTGINADINAGAGLRAGARVTALADGATASWLDGDRLFLQHGPINLIVRAGGPAPAVDAAYRALIDVFPGWLGALVEELPRLRSPESRDLALPVGPIARRMAGAVRACTSGFVTPMAAVAGAVADEAVAVLAAQPRIEHAYVNNGGDIALHPSPGTSLSVGVVPSLRDAIPRARIEIASDSAVRGVATSGWEGRSHSFGIADAVTVLARNAAVADAAATLIANAVDVDHPGIQRTPARALDEQSDLGDRPVTVAVPALDAEAIELALDAGLRRARGLRDRGVIEGVAVAVQGRWRVLEALGTAPGQHGPRTPEPHETPDNRGNIHTGAGASGPTSDRNGVRT